MTEDSFEMLEKNKLNQNKLNPVLVLNIINIINIINFVWNNTKKDVVKLHKILLELNITFSCLKSEEQI